MNARDRDRQRRAVRADTPHAAGAAGKPEGPCPIMRSCGGCEWLNLPYRKQLARKQAATEELFGPLIEHHWWDAVVDPIVPAGPLPGEPPAAIGRLAAPRAFRYKAATPFAPGEHGRVTCGFYARGTHRIVPCEFCAVEAPGMRDLLNGVARAAERCGIPAYDEDRRAGALRHAIVRKAWKTEEAMLTVVSAQQHLPHEEEFAGALRELDPRLSCVAVNVNPRQTNAMLGGQTHIMGRATCLRDELLGCTFEISPTAFYQTNPALTEMLYGLAIEGMALKPGDVLLDAYCGSGTIGICAAHEAAARGARVQVLGVERNPDGVHDAQRNAQLNNLHDSCRFVCDDATRYLERAAAEGAHVDAVVLDPPRAGSTEAFIAAVAALAPARVVYISCNPATQARDLEWFASTGYRLVRLTPVDMFPHTSHVETVAVLER